MIIIYGLLHKITNLRWCCNNTHFQFPTPSVESKTNSLFRFRKLWIKLTTMNYSLFHRTTLTFWYRKQHPIAVPDVFSWMKTQLFRQVLNPTHNKWISFSLIEQLTHWCDVLCLKYYNAPSYRMRYVIIVLVERRRTGCKNKWSSLLRKQRIFTKT